MDFFHIGEREIEKGPNKGKIEIYPDFQVGRSQDLMVRGRSFYAIWDEEVGLWSTDEYDVQRLVDVEIKRHAEKMESDGREVIPRYLRVASNQGWYQFKKFVQHVSDNQKDLDNNLTFANTEVKKSDYASRRLPYPLQEGEYSAWDELVGTLYSVEERAKIEWAIGAVVSGDAKKLQKFLVFYGPGGTGKSTIINIIQSLFVGYTTTFDAKALGSVGAAFATEVFKSNPLVAYQHDGDLSKIEDNTRLNSIISHEDMPMNEKYKPGYTSRINAFLFMGTNQPVKISDSKSGIIRRLIDVHPTGVKIPENHYNTLMAQIEFELGAIAYRCLSVYREMGKKAYSAYRPVEMMFQTDVFYNFIEWNYDIFKQQDGTTLKQAHDMYKEFCASTGIEKPMPQYKMRGPLADYFEEFHDRIDEGGTTLRSVYRGFNAEKFKTATQDVEVPYSLVMDETTSLLDKILAEQPAQYGTEMGIPGQRWENVTTTLADLDTSKLHFVKVPENHIVIDFDLKDEHGKSLERNLGAASSWPTTYGELSQGGGGVHLHYRWTGATPVSELSPNYSDGIEVKVYRGGASLRRRVSRANAVGMADLASGLPLKEKKVLEQKTIGTEKGLRDMIARNLKKEFHVGTKPSIDFIKHILDEAYNSGLSYDVSDLKSRLMLFANNSTNQSLMCLKVVQQMRFQGQEAGENDPQKGAMATADPQVDKQDARIAFYDVEVYPNLIVVCWKYQGADQVVRMINPGPKDIEALMSLKLVGFNNRRYDNHILWAIHMGYTTEGVYKLSQKLIDNDRNAAFGEAYNLSYCDIYEFSSKKQSLKKFMIELGIHKMEMDLPWDQPVAEELWPKIVEYCVNDVIGTEKTFDDRKGDFVARQILAELSGLSMNDTTQRHTAKILFGDDRRPQSKFVYTKLEEMFPGYEFDKGKSTYKGEDPSEGGYVYAVPGMYENVAVMDVASMHPTSIIQLNAFGPYTKNFEGLVAARLAIKRGDFEGARKIFPKLGHLLKDESNKKPLSDALKIAINIVYGLTSAKFDNAFRDPKNIDNIVAKRGALFMIDLKNACEDKGMSVVHIKTDSIKIADATPADLEFVHAFGKQYGYDFEHENTYDKFCLVNDAVYIACEIDPWAGPEEAKKWTAVGAQFQHPYVYKTLFSKQDLTFDDFCETKQVTKGVMYLDFEYEDKVAALNTGEMKHIGRIGRFIPVLREFGLGGTLWRIQDGKQYAVSGTKGYLWMEAEQALDQGVNPEIDTGYHEGLVNDAIKAINKYGDFEKFAQ